MRFVLGEQPTQVEPPEVGFEDSVMAATDECKALPPEVRDAFHLPQYCAQQRDATKFREDRGHRPQQNNDLNRAIGKITLATYNGSSGMSA